MFKSTFKSFYKNGKFIFMIAGIVYLAIILFVFFLISGTIAICGDSINIMIKEIVNILNDYMATFSLAAVWEVPAVLGNIMQSINNNIGEFSNRIIALLLALLLLVFLAVEVSKSFAIIYIRNESLKTNLLANLVSIALRTLLSLGFIVLFAYLASLWIYSIFILVVPYLIAKAALNVVYIELAYRKRVSFKQMMRPKTLIKLQLLYVMSFVLTILVAAVLMILLNVLVAALLIIPIAVYFNACVEGNSYGYFVGTEMYQTPSSPNKKLKNADKK